uniref:Uncharacterized protein n=1 Tax=Chenopodium quinoa TaxID=63459 RepID=A0A803LHV5_CHEQI
MLREVSGGLESVVAVAFAFGHCGFQLMVDDRLVVRVEVWYCCGGRLVIGVGWSRYGNSLIGGWFGISGLLLAGRDCWWLGGLESVLAVCGATEMEGGKGVGQWCELGLDGKAGWLEREALNEALRAEVQRLRIATGQNLSGINISAGRG